MCLGVIAKMTSRISISPPFAHIKRDKVSVKYDYSKNLESFRILMEKTKIHKYQGNVKEVFS